MPADDSHRDRVDASFGVEAIEGVDDDSAADGLLPFDPRRKGPRDVLRDARSWIYAHRFWVAGAVVLGFAILHFVDIPLPELPVWTDVAVVAGGIAIVAGTFAGYRVGGFFSNPQYKILDQLDAKTADQLTIKISINRWQDLRVVDYEGEERSTNYLKSKTWNGHPAWEVDRYYPAINTAVASWQAGATNKDLRDYERQVDLVKTKLEKEANEAIEARVNAKEEARQQAQQTSNYVLAVSEAVLQPGEGDLAGRLSRMTERDESQTQEDLLSGLEDDLLNGNGHSDDADAEDVEAADSDRLDQLKESASNLVVSLDPRGGGGE